MLAPRKVDIVREGNRRSEDALETGQRLHELVERADEGIWGQVGRSGVRWSQADGDLLVVGTSMTLRV